MDPNDPSKIQTGFSDLINQAIDFNGPSRFLFTCWECPTSECGIKPFCKRLSGLTEDAARQLLRANGLTESSDTDLNAVITRYFGHPVSLKLFVQSVKDNTSEQESLAVTLKEMLKDNALWTGSVEKKIFEKVFKKTTEEDQAFLKMLSIFREPVPIKAVKELIDTANLQGSGKSPWDIESNANKLLNTPLLKSHKGLFSEESFIQRIIYENIFVDDRQFLHEFASNYYERIDLPSEWTKKEDVHPLIEAHYHACMTNDLDKAAKIIFDNKLDEALGRWGNNTLLKKMLQMLIPPKPLDYPVVLTELPIHAIALGALGIVYNGLDESKKAIECLSSALEIVHKIKECKIQDFEYENKWLGHMGIAYSLLCDYSVASRYFDKALDITQKWGFKKDQCRWLADKGANAYYLGNYIDSLRYSDEALTIAQSNDFKEYEGRWLGNIGDNYLALRDYEKARLYLTQSYEIAEKLGNTRDKSARLITLGLICNYIDKDKAKAISYEKEALRISRESGHKAHECQSLGTLGIISFSSNNFNEAIEYYLQAYTIANAIEDKWRKSLWLYKLSEVFFSDNKPVEALTCYLLAKRINVQSSTSWEIADIDEVFEKFEQSLKEDEFIRLIKNVADHADDIFNGLLKQHSLPAQSCSFHSSLINTDTLEMLTA
jgi:tetratricopeptide (TPR) repeat protein